MAANDQRPPVSLTPAIVNGLALDK